MQSVLAIAIGGALGALSRHYMNILLSMAAKVTFPVGILFVNVLGCFAMGVLIACFTLIWNPSQEVKLFLLTGFLGAFTTFSAFSLDVMTLWSRGAVFEVLAYVLTSVILSILAVFLGHWIIWKIYGAA